MTEEFDPARHVMLFADYLDERFPGFQATTGSMRRTCKELADLRKKVAAVGNQDAGCERCGGPIEQPARGRRRRFCARKCREAAWRRSSRAIPSGILTALGFLLP
jgi:formamidopyrimidine-DNA glycosylase